MVRTIEAQIGGPRVPPSGWHEGLHRGCHTADTGEGSTAITQNRVSRAVVSIVKKTEYTACLHVAVRSVPNLYSVWYMM